ncbi:MAG: hypothetical protein KU37_06190 [Sulfuricurvum sp. PC08-66]|nr:MAG: hypothetical protein KU37_06190 [Sulfuricurvum sp. PC08-66]
MTHEEQIQALQAQIDALKNSHAQTLKEMLDQKLHDGEALIDEAVSLVKAHPVKSIAIALGVGILLGQLRR